MKACKSCGQLYDDEATYCNICDIALDSKGSDSVYDVNQITKENHKKKTNQKVLIKLIISLMLLMPFILIALDLMVFKSLLQKLLFLSIYELASVITLLIYRKRTSYFLPAISVLILLNLCLFPLGLLSALVLTFYMIQILR